MIARALRTAAGNRFPPRSIDSPYGASPTLYTPPKEGLTGSAVRVVVEPSTDDERPELRLQLEPERTVELLCIVGLQADVLARHLVEQQSDHRGCDASPAVGRRCPHVDEVRVADAVREQTSHADHSVAVARERHVLRLFERTAQRG